MQVADLSHRHVAAVTRLTIVLLVAVSAGALIAGSAHARSDTATADAAAGWKHPALVAYGYPFASRCPGAGIADVVDRWGMYACNCTSFVAWALAANDQRTDWFVRGAMNAWNWPNVARRASFTVDEHPARGAVAVWAHVARPFGHLAYVTGVGPDGTIDVAEYNYPVLGDNTYAFDVRDDVSTHGAVFIHVPRRS